MEVSMTSTDASGSTSAQMPEAGTIDMKLEVVTLNVTDIDRAKGFYQSLGWRLDADIAVGDAFRVVQLTPTQSACSVAFGKGVTTGEPGSVQRLILAVDDIDAARADLVSRGIEISGLFHLAGGPVPGPDPEGRSYATLATFRDPDGNSWLLQEIKTRLPGRGLSNLDVASLTELLREAEERHGDYEATAPKHHWSDWYAAYIVAREQGRTEDEAAKDGAVHMEQILR